MTRPSAHRRGYTRSWRAIVRAAIEVHVRLYGWTCPGWGVPAHYSTDLTGDHDLALALGGLSTRGNVRVLCRSCNARKGNRPPVRVQLSLDAALAGAYREGAGSRRAENRPFAIPGRGSHTYNTGGRVVRVVGPCLLQNPRPYVHASPERNNGGLSVDRAQNLRTDRACVGTEISPTARARRKGAAGIAGDNPGPSRPLPRPTHHERSNTWPNGSGS